MRRLRSIGKRGSLLPHILHFHHPTWDSRRCPNLTHWIFNFMVVAFSARWFLTADKLQAQVRYADGMGGLNSSLERSTIEFRTVCQLQRYVRPNDGHNAKYGAWAHWKMFWAAMAECALSHDL